MTPKIESILDVFMLTDEQTDLVVDGSEASSEQLVLDVRKAVAKSIGNLNDLMTGAGLFGDSKLNILPA